MSNNVENILLFLAAAIAIALATMIFLGVGALAAMVFI